jgi:amino acid permease
MFLLVRYCVGLRSLTNILQAVLNVVYSTFNIGVVALPFVAEEAGLPLFITALILISVSSAYTTCMVINMANEHGVKR